MPNATLPDFEAFRREAYRLYQLDWMASHGHSVTDLVRAVIAYAASAADPEDPETADVALIDPEELMAQWENGDGFGSDVWACFGEFLDAEYKDEAYMSLLLNTQQLDMWRKDVT